MEATLNIKNFGDYREFLRSHFEEKQKTVKTWSYGNWAKRLGLKATSSLTKIMNGEREPGPEITTKLVGYFKFDSVQANYFSDLIRLSKSKEDIRLRVMIMEKMGREHPDARIQVLDDKSFAIISNWFCMTIREMVRLSDFQEDPKWIQQRLRYSVKTGEIAEALKNLQHQGLIRRNKEGRLVTSEGLLRTTDDVASEAIRNYHEQTLEIAKQSLREVSVDLREFTSETLTINASNIPACKELIREFRAKFSRLMEEQQGDETYQLQIQFFPFTSKENL